ncbi:MAG TPA: enoyl-CoA hydratase/isomerase family protein [Thermoleophilaceae bacterium]|jgi:enoyl-CoA hydratase/carnithine racemase
MAVTYASGQILLDKPPANSYDIDFMRELGAAVDAADSDSDALVVVVRSASEKFFSAGADIKAFLAGDVEANMEMIRVAHDSLGRMAESDKLFIAWIAGHALGGGLEIALACDLRYGLETGYRVGTPEVTLGLLPGNGGTQRLPRLIGLGPALDLLLTGRQLEPAEARSLGVLSGLFASEDDFLAHVGRLAAGAPLAVGNIKRAAYQGSQVSLENGLALERDLIEQLFRSNDSREGLTAFTEKRAPAFTGG